MKIRAFVLIAIGQLAGLLTAGAAEPATLESHLEPLRPLLEKTWKGEFKNSKPEQPTVDVVRWERALNGQAVRVLHSINDGIYGGELLIYWDKQRQVVAYNYFTTAGFTTAGTVKFEKDKFITHEIVTGSSEGITEVRGTSEISPDGTYHVRSEYLKNGNWIPGHEATYRPDAAAKVVFR